jgi:hypothetical protein
MASCGLVEPQTLRARALALHAFVFAKQTGPVLDHHMKIVDSSHLRWSPARGMTALATKRGGWRG